MREIIQNSLSAENFNIFQIVITLNHILRPFQ